MCAQLPSRVWLFATPWTIAHQVPLSMGFSRQVYWSGLPLPTPGNLPNQGTELVSLASPALACYSLPLGHLGRLNPCKLINYNFIWVTMHLETNQLVADNYDCHSPHPPLSRKSAKFWTFYFVLFLFLTASVRSEICFVNRHYVSHAQLSLDYQETNSLFVPDTECWHLSSFPLSSSLL